MASTLDKSLTVSILIPSLNEEKNLPFVLPRIPSLPEIIEIILIDGSSTDNTIKVAKDLMPGIKIVLDPGIGKGEAINCGARAASGDYFLILDADGSHRPEEISLYIAKAKEGYDLVKGSRFLGGIRTDDETLDHAIALRVAQFTANTLWHTSFTDICYGMLLIDRQKYLALRIMAKRYDVEWELMAKAAKASMKIVEVPVRETRRLNGKSHLSIIKDGWIIAKAVFREGLRKREA